MKSTGNRSRLRASSFQCLQTALACRNKTSHVSIDNPFRDNIRTNLVFTFEVKDCFQKVFDQGAMNLLRGVGRALVWWIAAYALSCSGFTGIGYQGMLKRTRSLSSRLFMSDQFNAAMIVPTGVGAAIGGYAGDALPSARLLASAVDNLIVHPNVANGAMLFWPIPNMLYVEGSSLDAFADGQIGLRPVRKGSNRIGLLLDKGIEEDLRTRHLHVADGMRATLGIDVAHCVVTSRDVGVKLRHSQDSGASWGSVTDTETLVEGARALVDDFGCTAVAVVVRFPEDSDPTEVQRFEQYRQGGGVDGIGGAEALISHVIGKALGVPCAHAPAFSPMEPDPSVSPKACAEELGYTFLPCVLAYLHTAPQLVPLGGENSVRAPLSGSVLTNDDVDVVVAPYNALGGEAVLSFLAKGKTVIAVTENETSMRVTAAALQKQQGLSQGKIITARSYAEAAGLVLALKNGILLESLAAHVDKMPVSFL